jgi:putative transposase
VLQTEVFTRRYLPHWFVPGAAHFVTYRLHGTLPATELNELMTRKTALFSEKPRPDETPARRRERVHKQLFATYDRYLDATTAVRWLADPRVAALVRSNLYHHHNTKYHLLAYYVMPNHAHVLLIPLDTSAQSRAERLPEEHEDVGEAPDDRNSLSAIMHSLKSYTAHAANKLLRRTGPFWQAESYDHWVRDEDELTRIVQYIANNPVKAGLVERPQDWAFCSAHDRFLTDGDASAWLRWES